MIKKEYSHNELTRISNKLKITQKSIDRIIDSYPDISVRPWHEDKKLKVLKDEVKRQLSRSPWNQVDDAIAYKECPKKSK